MKLIISTILLFITINTNAQSSDSYSLKISGITNPQEAKQVTDLIRSIINDSEEPFKNYPSFNNEEDVFEFKSVTHLTKEILQEKLSPQGYEIVEFKTRAKLTPISN